jgi:uncharacterized integral membrane protein
MKSPKIIITLIIVFLIIIVLAQNAKAIEVKFLFWSFSASAFVMYIIFYFIGIISAIVGMFWRKI